MKWVKSYTDALNNHDGPRFWKEWTDKNNADIWGRPDDSKPYVHVTEIDFGQPTAFLCSLIEKN